MSGLREIDIRNRMLRGGGGCELRGRAHLGEFIMHSANEEVCQLTAV